MHISQTVATAEWLSRALIEKRNPSFAESEAYQRKAIAIARKGLGPEDPETFYQQYHLVEFLDQRERLQEAERLQFKQALGFERSKSTWPKDIPDVFARLGQILWKQKKGTEAEIILRHTWRGWRNIPCRYAHEPACNLAQVLGQVLHFQGKFAEAERFHRIVFGTRTTDSGGESEITRTAGRELQKSPINVGKYDEIYRLQKE